MMPKELFGKAHNRIMSKNMTILSEYIAINLTLHFYNTPQFNIRSVITHKKTFSYFGLVCSKTTTDLIISYPKTTIFNVKFSDINFTRHYSTASLEHPKCHYEVNLEV
jgi:hypothetical protein